jgi:hypothetical protein
MKVQAELNHLAERTESQIYYLDAQLSQLHAAYAHLQKDYAQLAARALAAPVPSGLQLNLFAPSGIAAVERWR